METESKVKRLKEGDKNMRFFHRVASTRRNTNFIHSLLDENDGELDPDSLKSHIVSYFMKLYKEPGVRRPLLNGV